MAFADKELSVAEGEPIELYLFRYGEQPTSVFGFTDGELDVVVPELIGGQYVNITYRSVPIERSAIKTDGTLERSDIEVRTDQDSPLSDLFRLYPPSQTVTLTIKQGHNNDPTAQFLVVWAGRVTGWGVDPNAGGEAKFTCQPISTSLKRVGLRRHYQYGCPHVLYGPQCGADKAAAKLTRTVLAVDGATLQLGANWAPSDRIAKYLGGLAEWRLDDGRIERRTILKSEADGTIGLGGYAYGLSAGRSVDLFYGCNRRMGVGPQPDGDCGPLHNNIHNFGGFAWIPTKSPFGLKNIYY